MLRLPSQLDIGPYTIHLDVLAARLQRRRRRFRRTLIGLLAFAAVLTLAWFTVPRLRGSGVVIVPAPPTDVQLTLDGQPVTSGALAVVSGEHTLLAERAGAFPASQTIRVTKDQTITLTLPPLRAIPVIQSLPLPHQQSVWSEVSTDAGGGWRLQATRPAIEASVGARPGWGPSQTTTAPYVLHLDAQGLTRLSVLETYPVADEVVMASGARFWAMWEPRSGMKVPGVAGTLTLTTPAGSETILTTSTLRGVWWAPGGKALLVAFPHDQGLDLALLDPLRPSMELTPLITVPGSVKSVHWHPDGRAVVIISALDAPRDTALPGASRPAPTQPPADETTALAYNAVLIQMPSTGVRQPTRLRVPPIRPAGLLPLAWTDTALWWVTDTGLGLALDRVDLASGSVRRIGSLPDDLAALTVMPDDSSVRIVRSLPDGSLSVQRWPEGEVLLRLPGLHAAGPVGGTWRGGDLLLATSPTSLWYIQMQAEALR